MSVLNGLLRETENEIQLHSESEETKASREQVGWQKLSELVNREWPEMIFFKRTMTMNENLDDKKFIWSGDAVTLDTVAPTLRTN